jgi:hypothetical protein
MKDYQEQQDVLKTINDFRTAWSNLDSVWQNNSKLLDELSDSKLYPFVDCFSEKASAVFDWCVDIENKLTPLITEIAVNIENVKQRLISVEYRNTGGNCMVLVYKYVSVDKHIKWLYVDYDAYTNSYIDYLADPDWAAGLYDIDDVDYETGIISKVTPDHSEYWMIMAAAIDYTNRQIKEVNANE